MELLDPAPGPVAVLSLACVLAVTLAGAAGHVPVLALLLATGVVAQDRTPPRPGAQDFDVVATFLLDGKERVLSRQVVALELARTYWVRDYGAEALNHLIDLRLVEQAARDQQLMPSRDEVKGQVLVLEARLLQRKQSLDEVLKTRRLTRSAFEKQLAMGLAKQRLVLKALGETSKRVPTETELELWSKQTRAKAKVVLDRERLPAGVLATVDGAEISSADLGDILFIKVSTDTLTRAVKDLAFRAIVKSLGKQQNIRITEQDVDANVRQRQLQHEQDKQRGKLPFADLLKATTGLTVAQYKRDPHMRAQVLFQKLVAARYPASVLMERYLADKRNILKRHGARRKISVLLVRTSDRPNQLVKLDPKAARKRIEELQQEIKKKKSFAVVARLESEGPNKKEGGAIGWCHQEDKKAPVPQEVLNEAFAAEINKVKGPVRTKEGFWLAWVSGIEPEPDDDLVLKGLRNELARDYLEELFAAAHIQMKVR